MRYLELSCTDAHDNLVSEVHGEARVDRRNLEP